MRILVMGAAEYIRYHIVYELIDKGYEVVIVECVKSGNIEPIHPEARYYYGDICETGFINCVLDKERIDVVIYFSNNTAMEQNLLNPLQGDERHAYKVKVVMESIITHRVNKIIFSSSSSCYWESKHISMMENNPVDYKNTYGLFQSEMDHLVKYCVKAFNVNFISLKYFNAADIGSKAYDNHLNKQEVFFVPLAIQMADKNKKVISVYKNNYETREEACARSYVHVSNLAKIHVSAIDYLLSGDDWDTPNFESEFGFITKEVINVVGKAPENHVADKDVWPDI